MDAPLKSSTPPASKKNATPNIALPLSRSQAAPSSGLFSLPRELQDIIFDLAYPQDVLRLQSRVQWESSEIVQRMLSSSNYEVRSFPPVKVNDFLVSKQFFKAATSAYVGNQRICYDLVERVDQLQPSSFGMSKTKHHVLRECVTYLWIDRWSTPSRPMPCLENFPTLKRIHFQIFVSDFPKSVDNQFIWETIFDEDDLKDSPLYNIFSRGYKRIIVVTSPDHHCFGASGGGKIWKQNAQNFEDLINKQVKEAKTVARQSPRSSGTSPVSLGTSSRSAPDGSPLPSSAEILEEWHSHSSNNHSTRGHEDHRSRKKTGSTAPAPESSRLDNYTTRSPSPSSKSDTACNEIKLNWGSFDPSPPRYLQQHSKSFDSNRNDDDIAILSDTSSPSSSPKPVVTQPAESEINDHSELAAAASSAAEYEQYPSQEALESSSEAPSFDSEEKPQAVTTSYLDLDKADGECIAEADLSLTSTITKSLLNQITHSTGVSTTDLETLHLLHQAKDKLASLETALRAGLHPGIGPKSSPVEHEKKPEVEQEELWDPGFFLLVLMFMLPWALCVGIMKVTE